MSRLSQLVAEVDDAEYEDVVVPRWNGVKIRLRSMDLQHRGDYLKRLVQARADGEDALAELQAEIVVASAFDPEDGSQVFTPADIPMLLSKHGGIVGMLANKASRLSGLDADAEERLGKAFLDSPTETPSGDSTST